MILLDVKLPRSPFDIEKVGAFFHLNTLYELLNKSKSYYEVGPG